MCLPKSEVQKLFFHRHRSGHQPFTFHHSCYSPLWNKLFTVFETFLVIFLITGSMTNGASLSQVTVAHVLPKPIRADLVPSTQTSATNLSSANKSLFNSTRYDKTISVPPQLSLSSAKSSALKISDTNQTLAAVVGSNITDPNVTSSLPFPSSFSPPQVSSRANDSDLIAQKQLNITTLVLSTTTTPTDIVHVNHENDIHKTFLLMCSAHSIRFWSSACPVHSTNTLLSHTGSRSSSIPYGITSLAVWHPSDNTDGSVELIWFDVDEKQYHRAALQRQHQTDCEYLLGIELNQTLDYRSNPFATNANEAFLKEKMVKIAIDSRNQLLFASNYMQNRVDVYRLDGATAANNEMVWLASIDALHPTDIALDDHEKIAVWLEGRKRICHLRYRLESDHFLQLNRNLTLEKLCTDELLSTPPLAITLDKKNKQIVWGSREGRIYSIQYEMTSDHAINPRLVAQVPEDSNSIHTMAMIDSDTLYFSDESLAVRSFHMETKQFDLVSIESNTLFDLVVVNNLTTTDTMQYSAGGVTANDSTWSSEPSSSPSPPPTTTTPDHDSVKSDNPTHSNQTTLLFNTFSLMSHRSTILLITLVPLLFIVVIVSALYVYCLPKHRPDLSCTSHFCFLSNRFSHYNQLRKNRASSTGRDELIVTDEEYEHHSSETNQTKYDDSDGDKPPNDQLRGSSVVGGHQYRQNLVCQSGQPMDDIEDIFGGGGFAHHRPPPTCMACRDSDICQDKGICMATYRVL